ncbi:unnamed protein product [Tetraodon nigroviridis]|uniref:Chromosome undetermined SCAF14696, whole genome shotgun sequence n=1 Tax=Tetraodon nigroviridis TaxID=99883 RepID=Q4S9I1_TETNG|nr:unnamed protein product [Tetraodon nigroviridis]
MEEKKEEGDSEIQGHGPEHWFSKWERQCLAEAEQRELSEEEIGCATSRACPCGCHSRTPLLHLLTCTKDMLAWVKKRRRTIRREDLISFLCGKAPPHRSSRANPRLTVGGPSRANSPAETGSSVEADLQPFREAIALHASSGLVVVNPGWAERERGRRNGLQDVDLNTFISEEMALHLDSTGSASAGGGATRKRSSTQCSDVITDSPTHKRNRMI